MVKASAPPFLPSQPPSLPPSLALGFSLVASHRLSHTPSRAQPRRQNLPRTVGPLPPPLALSCPSPSATWTAWAAVGGVARQPRGRLDHGCVQCVQRGRLFLASLPARVTIACLTTLTTLTTLCSTHAPPRPVHASSYRSERGLPSPSPSTRVASATRPPAVEPPLGLEAYLGLALLPEAIPPLPSNRCPVSSPRTSPVSPPFTACFW